MIYQGATSTIGSLLRLIEEEKTKAPTKILPQTEPGSAIRGLVQGPLESAESPGSSRVVSIKPEAATMSGPEATPAGRVIAPVAPRPVPTPSVVAPMAPAPAGGGMPAPSYNAPVPTPVPTPTMPKIGTSITGSVQGAKTSAPVSSSGGYSGVGGFSGISRFVTPQRSRSGAPIVGGPTPTPAEVNKMKQKDRIWGSYWG